jgi:bacteriocin biosynthesis cyclodehydratase domain-containing protein
MKLELQSEKLRVLPVNLIDTGDGVVIKRGRVELRIAGTGAGDAVGRLLDCARNGATRDELVALFPAGEIAGAEALIDHLRSRSILVSEEITAGDGRSPESPLEVFYWHFGTQTAQVVERLNAKRIKITGVNYISRQLIAGLRASGAEEFEVIDQPLLRNEALFDDGGALRMGVWSAPVSEYVEDLDPDTLDCVIATSDSGGVEQMRLWNEFCVLYNLQFVPVILQDLVGYIGPIVVPGQTPCFECVRLRQNAHLLDCQTRRAVEAAFIHKQAIGGFHPSMATILGDIAALEITKYFGIGGSIARPGTLIRVNLLGSEMKPLQVLKVPRCPVCSRLNRTPSTALTRASLSMPKTEVGQ